MMIPFGILGSTIAGMTVLAEFLHRIEREDNLRVDRAVKPVATE